MSIEQLTWIMRISGTLALLGTFGLGVCVGLIIDIKKRL